MSLNNRIAIRDSYEAHGPVVNTQVMRHFENSARQGLTTDSIILEPENLQEHSMSELAGEADVEERVNSEWCERQVIISLAYASSSSHNYIHCVMPMMQTGVVISDRRPTTCFFVFRKCLFV